MRIGVAIVALVLLVVVGCSDDKSTFLAVPDPSPSLALEPDTLVAHLVQSYIARDTSEYDRLLHDDFRFEFTSRDSSLTPDHLPIWGRDAELASALALMTGEEGHRADGTTQPAVKTLSLFLVPLEPWRDASARGPGFQGSLERRFGVDMTIDYGGGTPSAVNGEQILFVTPVTRTVSGEELEIYELLHWKDLGRSVGRWPVQRPGVAVETISWGRLKARYHPLPLRN